MGLRGAGGVKNFSVGICDGAPSTARSSLKFGVARDDGLDARKCTLHIKQWLGRYEQVEQVHARIQEFLSGGGGVEARRPENSLDNVFF